MRNIMFVMWKELLELRQNPRLFPVLFLAPLIQLTVLGYAATTDVRNVPVLVVDTDRTVESRGLIRSFDASANFTIVDVVGSIEEIDSFLEARRAWMALTIPTDFGRLVREGRPAVVQVVADGSDANSTNVALGYTTNLVSDYSLSLAASRPAARMANGPVPTEIRRSAGLQPIVRVWFNSRLESRYFMLPGIVALLLLVVTTNLSSMAIVREKEVGTLEQLSVTPLGRLELIVGKLLPYAIVGIIDVALTLVVVLLWFEVPMRGSFALLFLMSSIYLLTALGLGLFVSTISQTQQQAMMTTTFFFLIPMIYLSGFVFPIENMPAAMQHVTYIIPLRYFIVIVRGLFLKGVGLETFWREALVLLAWGVGILGLAIWRSRKRVD
jgi:ABC-2 type transport system permease protein